MPRPLVYVLVINWNGREHLEACFDSLLMQSYDNTRVLLVDNASTDESIGFVQQRFGDHPRVEILRCGSNLGWSSGNNIGIEHALESGADYVFLLNNDTATAPDAVERLVEFAEQHAKAGALAPKMLLFDQPYLINSIGIACSVVGSAWDEGLGRVDGPRWGEPRKVLGVCGGAMFLRAEALRAAGNLPGDFEIYLDDLDLCLRIWDAGFECWSCPAAIVRHKFSATMGEGARARRKYYLNTRNRLRLILRNYPLAQLASIFVQYALSEVRSIGRATSNGELWKVLTHVQSWFAAVAYLAKAISHRRSIRDRGRSIGTFWGRVRKDIQFFPGVPLPDHGWYAPTLRGFSDHGQSDYLSLHPISSRATIEVATGELSVTHANCYPRLGATDVELRSNGLLIANLTVVGAPKTERFAVEAGTLELVSRHIFEVESTGELIDIGGWIALHPPQPDRLEN